MQQAQNAIQLFEKQTLSKFAQRIHCSFELNALSSIINAFLYEKQQKLLNEFEYKRQILILDATDHRLLQAFFDFNPRKSQVQLDSIMYLLVSIFSCILLYYR